MFFFWIISTLNSEINDFLIFLMARYLLWFCFEEIKHKNYDNNYQQ